MSQRQFAFSYGPTPVDEAPGVTIRRVIGGDRMAILDPFMLLDHASLAAGSEVVGFHRHPHRGIETLSYVITGEVGHKDSLGNEGAVGPGGTQWMTAGNGIFHEEMLIPGPEGAEFLQLWFSLPRSSKRIPPGYVGCAGADVPEVVEPGSVVRVVSGFYGTTRGAFQGIAVHPTVLDVQLSAGASLEIPTGVGDAAFAYVVRGSVSVTGREVTAPEIVVLTDGESVTFSAGPSGGRLLFVAAMPLNEPILQYRSVVMNTVEDIKESVEMIESGSFGG